MRWTHSKLTRDSPAWSESASTFPGRGTRRKRLTVVSEAPARAWTVKQVAAALGVHPSTAYGLCGRGELAHFRVARAIWIRPQDLAAFVEERGREGERA